MATVTEFLIDDNLLVRPFNISVLVFSRDRPLFLDAHLETLASTKTKSMDVTVYFMATPGEMETAYNELTKKYSWAKFARQARREDLLSFLTGWIKNARKYTLVTVDDNIYSEALDVEAICDTMKDESVFGFTLRLHPGIRHTVDGGADDPGPSLDKRIITYNPSEYGRPWNYVWEMSSTIFRRDDLMKVVCSGRSILSVNDLETVGQKLFPTSSVKKMACFNRAPVTNIFVDSWCNPQLCKTKVPNDFALKMYKDGKRIDVEETFRCRDRQATTHVKELFMKVSLKNSAIVIVPSWNAEKWTEKCLRSILDQTYQDIGIVFIDDASDDKTAEIARKILEGRKNVVTIFNKQRCLALKNVVTAIREHCGNPESVIFTVDGDDWLDCLTAIEEMMKQHETHDVVWSQYRRTDGSAGHCASLTHGNIRKHPWVSSHLRSWKKFLFDAIKDEDLREDNGNYYRSACDLAIMIPILEMTLPERRLFYDRCLYVYNRDNPLNNDKANKGQQQRIENRIRLRRPYSFHSRYVTKKRHVVSIIIPCFNYGKYLSTAIQSALSQSYKDFELILVDYGSTDNTATVMAQHKAEAIILTIPNRGLSNARNKGIAVAEGEYILCLDADDALMPDFLKEAMEKAGPKTIVATRAYYFGNQQRFFIPCRRTDLEAFKYGNRILSVSLFPKTVWAEIGGYDENMLQLEDWDFWMRAIAAECRVEVVNEILVTIRQHGDSRNSDSENHSVWYSYMMKKCGYVRNENMDCEYGNPLENMDYFNFFPREPIHLPIVSVAVETRPEMMGRIRQITEWHRKWFRFDREIVVSNVDPNIPGTLFVNCGSPPPSVSARLWYSDMCVHWLHQLCSSSHILIWQWDGFILNPELWTDEFLKWDYAGSPLSGVWIVVAEWLKAQWPDWHNPFDVPRPYGLVGNGGFSLRSKKFLDATASLSRTGFSCEYEDTYLCVERRKELEDKGIEFCPAPLAMQFAREGGPLTDSFGFHNLHSLSTAKNLLQNRYLFNLLTPASQSLPA